MLPQTHTVSVALGFLLLVKTVATAATVPVVSIAGERDDRIWRLALDEGRLVVDSSVDRGRTFTGRTVITTPDEKVDPRPETRPLIWVDARGTRWVTYERLRGRLYTGDIVVRRAVPGGAFSGPIVVNDNLEDIGHTYHTSGLNEAGDLFVVWLDDRGGNHIRDNGGRPKARGMYYAVLRSGAPLATPVNHLVAPDRVCDCCRPALAFAGSQAWLMARLATADGLRDHGSYRLGRDGVIGSMRPGPVDGWRIEGCPHHGPAVGVGADRRYHAVWFTGSDARQGLFYAYSGDEGRSYQGLRAIGDVARNAGHPALLVDGARVYVAWTERTGPKWSALVQRSDDAGVTWSAAQVIAEADGAVDYVFLHRSGNRVLASWATAERGHMIKDVDDQTASSRSHARSATSK
jgi:hypothetical protein